MAHYLFFHLARHLNFSFLIFIILFLIPVGLVAHRAYPAGQAATAFPGSLIITQTLVDFLKAIFSLVRSEKGHGRARIFLDFS
jgi:hypothetical protein